MRVNPDILETRKFQAIAQEFIDLNILEDIDYATAPHYTLLEVFAKSMTGKRIYEVQQEFPKTVSAILKLNGNFRAFDWPTLGVAVDYLRGRSRLSFDTP